MDRDELERQLEYHEAALRQIQAVKAIIERQLRERIALIAEITIKIAELEGREDDT